MKLLLKFQKKGTAQTYEGIWGPNMYWTKFPENLEIFLLTMAMP